MTMPHADLSLLLDDAEVQLSAALAKLTTGSGADLRQLAARMEEICRHAVEGRRKDLMPRLQQLAEQLTVLEDTLRSSTTSGSSAKSEVKHRHAAGIYRSAATQTTEHAGVSTRTPKLNQGS